MNQCTYYKVWKRAETFESMKKNPHINNLSVDYLDSLFHMYFTTAIQRRHAAKVYGMFSLT